MLSKQMLRTNSPSGKIAIRFWEQMLVGAQICDACAGKKRPRGKDKTKIRSSFSCQTFVMLSEASGSGAGFMCCASRQPRFAKGPFEFGSKCWIASNSGLGKETGKRAKKKTRRKTEFSFLSNICYALGRTLLLVTAHRTK